MSRREYTQTVQPVSRVPEKIFGWLAWLPLLAISLFSLYHLLVNGNNPEFIQSMKDGLNNEIQTNSQVADAFNQMGLTVEEAVPLFVKGFWYFLAYSLIPIILGLIGLLKMKKRIFAGIMLLLAGLFTTPFFFTFILGFIPLFFFIAAILLFARKDKVIKNNDYYEEHTHTEREQRVAPTHVERDTRIEEDKDFTYDADKKHDNVVVEDVDHSTVRDDRVDAHFDNNIDGDKDRVTYVDKTKDAVDERRDNYNNRR